VVFLNRVRALSRNRRGLRYHLPLLWAVRAKTAKRFPHSHTPGDYDGQMSNEALHQHSTWYKRSVRSVHDSILNGAGRTHTRCPLYACVVFPFESGASCTVILIRETLLGFLWLRATT
jgi:hypothetical protein